ncbi:MAG: histidine phosphatase family protein [Rubrobacter sp.]|nr:histidine phosphatase family protein [Rubrobacter sp.]
MGTFYLVRCCEAEGRNSDAPFTDEGFRQSERLADFLSNDEISRITSSPFVRAQRSIMPLSQRFGVRIEEDPRLAERVSCAAPMPD